MVIRRNSEDLKDWIDRAYKVFRHFGATRRGNPPEFVFPSGAVIRTGHLKDADSYTKYQGHEYHKMVIEELTQIDSETHQYERLISSCRSTIPELRPQIFLTTNPDPGTPGHKWVKRRFIDVSEPFKPYKDPMTGRSRIYIPSTVDDNPYIYENDPTYVNYLEGLQDQRLRDAWRYGKWEDAEVENAIFARWLNDLTKEGRVQKNLYDKTIPVTTYWDLGKNDATVITFVQHVGTEFRVIDCYWNNNESISYYAQILKDKGYLYDRHYAPHDIKQREDTGYALVTREDLARKAGIIFQPVPRPTQKINAIDATRQMLHTTWFDAENTRELLDNLRVYRWEYDNKENIKKDPYHGPESHFADSFMLCGLVHKSKDRPLVSEVKEEMTVDYLSSFV